MESTIVIKVKYGTILRRFNAHVDEAGKLELSIEQLRDKILYLFKLSPEVDLTLTYLDEDGDSVTIADDEDLHDVMRQSLNPLRIKAKVNGENVNTSSVSSSGNSTLMRSSPNVSHPLPNFNNNVSEILKAIPKPIEEALSKLSLDVEKSAASPLHLPELVQQFSNMLQSYMITASESQIASAGSESAKPSPMTKEPEALGGDETKPNMVAGPNSVNQRLKCEEKNDSGFITPGMNVYGTLGDIHRKEIKRSGESSLKPVAGKPAWENIKAVATSVLGTDNQKVKNPVAASPFYSNDFWNNNTNAGVFIQNVAGQCPFSETPVAHESTVPYTHFGPRVHPFKRSYNQGGVAGIFHSGVQCDGCGVHPITGPRFKSKVKHDYDLCSICFAEIGSEADYIRLDRPMPNRHCLYRKRVYDFNARANPSPTLPPSFTGVVKPNPLKLDSRFVTDVNVIDDTTITPSTPFTKVWRMRNNGTLAWPQGTQLVWIGGERLSAPLAANLQILADGFAIENELEVAVDFVAPEVPGRYISYWRMASPSGQKFGQRIWVLIQVAASAKDSAAKNNWQGLNLNLPPESNGVDRAGNEAISVGPILVNGVHPFPEPSNRATDLVEPLAVPLPTNNQDLDFPTNDNLLVSGIHAPPEVGPTTVSYPTVDSYPVLNIASPAPPPMPLVAEQSAQASADKDDVEQVLLRELEEMGFKQVDLNTEILRVNEYNLEQSVDDLCGVSEWDPILEELKEMGFSDNEVNKKLLQRNNGSIKGVVMDLITGKV